MPQINVNRLWTPIYNLDNYYLKSFSYWLIDYNFERLRQQ